MQEPILDNFTYAHLPPHLQVVSKPICELALEMAASFKPSEELSAGLRKLLEAKDCFVRCEVAKQKASPPPPPPPEVRSPRTG